MNIKAECRCCNGTGVYIVRDFLCIEVDKIKCPECDGTGIYQGEAMAPNAGERILEEINRRKLELNDAE